MGKQLIDLSGQRFGRLTVVEQAPARIKRYEYYIASQTMWHCVCDCGKSVIVEANNLKRGNTKSCGCLQREYASRRLKEAHKAAAILKEMGKDDEK